VLKPTVLLLEPITDASLELLSRQAEVIMRIDPTNTDYLAQATQIKAVITRGKGLVDRTLIDALPKLKIAARCGVGLDNIDVTYAQSKNIQIINAPGANAGTMAEHTIALLLVLKRNLYASIKAVKEDRWHWRNQYEGDEIQGKTLGIWGYGNIGKRVADLAHAFGMQIQYTSRSPKDGPYKWVTEEELLKSSDIISLHLPLSAQTTHLIGTESFAKLKPGAMLINTARGALIDPGALLTALQTNQLAGYAADVLPQEPPEPGDPLLQLPQVLITPHSGSLTATTFAHMCMFTVQKVLDHLDSNGCMRNNSEGL
jgi:D-3-phosphoglycerate dehydrogenase